MKGHKRRSDDQQEMSKRSKKEKGDIESHKINAEPLELSIPSCIVTMFQ